MGLVMELWSPRFVTYNTVIDCVKDMDYAILLLIVLSVVTCDCCKPMNQSQQIYMADMR